MMSIRTFVVGVLVCGATIAWSQPVEWKDRSPHAATLIPVDDNVQLEVLDWGGSGPAIVLLAGLGDTAHVFDDFAPMLTARAGTTSTIRLFRKPSRRSTDWPASALRVMRNGSRRLQRGGV